MQGEITEKVEGGRESSERCCGKSKATKSGFCYKQRKGVEHVHVLQLAELHQVDVNICCVLRNLGIWVPAQHLRKAWIDFVDYRTF